MSLIKAEIHKRLVRKANREDPDQTVRLQLQKQADLGLRCLSKRQSDQCLPCLSSIFGRQTFSIKTFRASPVNIGKIVLLFCQ